jgi:hypothetical protein
LEIGNFLDKITKQPQCDYFYNSKDKSSVAKMAADFDPEDKYRLMTIFNREDV